MSDFNNLPAGLVFYHLVRTCHSCPAQWDVRDDLGKLIWYIRYRFGVLAVQVYVEAEKPDGTAAYPIAQTFFRKKVGTSWDGDMGMDEMLNHLGVQAPNGEETIWEDPKGKGTFHLLEGEANDAPPSLLAEHKKAEAAKPKEPATFPELMAPLLKMMGSSIFTAAAPLFSQELIDGVKPLDKPVGQIHYMDFVKKNKWHVYKDPWATEAAHAAAAQKKAQEKQAAVFYNPPPPHPGVVAKKTMSGHTYYEPTSDSKKKLMNQYAKHSIDPALYSGLPTPIKDDNGFIYAPYIPVFFKEQDKHGSVHPPTS